MPHQDINECTGPQSKLTELNAEVKKNFHNLRLRIQVRNANVTEQHIGYVSTMCMCFYKSGWIKKEKGKKIFILTFSFYCQDLEQMAMEQDKESDKQVMISQVEGHRKQMLR